MLTSKKNRKLLVNKFNYNDIKNSSIIDNNNNINGNKNYNK